MARRFSVDRLLSGTIRLDRTQSRHARDALRMQIGDLVELFDSAGSQASARIIALTPDVQLEVGEILATRPRTTRLVVAAAIPKGNRADWMIEKLAELDITALIPLKAERSIVHPESGKLRRFARIATESAKQCHRRDVMQILPEQTPQTLCIHANAHSARWCLSTAGSAQPIACALPHAGTDVLAAIGPEGGWTDRELSDFANARFQSIALTQTILRIETAAVAVAAIVMSQASREEGRP